MERERRKETLLMVSLLTYTKISLSGNLRGIQTGMGDLGTLQSIIHEIFLCCALHFCLVRTLGILENDASWKGVGKDLH